MKFKEIISEANRQGSGLLGPMVTTPSGIQIPMWPSASLSARSSPPPAPKTKTGGEKLTQYSKILGKKGLRILGSDRYRPYLTSKSDAIKNGARFLRIWQFLGFGEMLLDFFNTKATLEIMKGLPNNDPSYITEEEYDTNVRQAGEILALQILASEAFPRLLQAMSLGKWIVRIIGFFGTAASWGATLALFVASEVAMIAFQRWLTSPEGKRSLSYLIVYVIDPLANWLYPTSLINKIKELVGMEQDKKPDETKPDDGKKPSTNSNQAAQPDTGARTDTTIRTPNVPSSYQGNPNDLMTKPTKKEPLPFS